MHNINRLTTIVSAIVLALLLSACGGSPVSESAKKEVLQKIKSGALVVDVRTPTEFNNGHYPGALNIPLQELEARLSEFGSKEGEIVVYCRSGRRSGKAKNLLNSKGYKNVTNAGGLRDMPSKQQ